MIFLHIHILAIILIYSHQNIYDNGSYLASTLTFDPAHGVLQAMNMLERMVCNDSIPRLMAQPRDL